MFAAHERAGVVVVGCLGKKRLYAFAYSQAAGFQFRRELVLVDVPRTLLCLAGAAAGAAAAVVVVGYKKFYESLELASSGTGTGTGAAQTALASRILDVEKEHKMVALEVSKPA